MFAFLLVATLLVISFSLVMAKNEKVTGIDYVKLLENWAAGMDWGEIWQENGFKDKPKNVDKTSTD